MREGRPRPAAHREAPGSGSPPHDLRAGPRAAPRGDPAAFGADGWRPPAVQVRAGCGACKPWAAGARSPSLPGPTPTFVALGGAPPRTPPLVDPPASLRTAPPPGPEARRRPPRPPAKGLPVHRRGALGARIPTASTPRGEFLENCGLSTGRDEAGGGREERGGRRLPTPPFERAWAARASRGGCPDAAEDLFHRPAFLEETEPGRGCPRVPAHDPRNKPLAANVAPLG